MAQTREKWPFEALFFREKLDLSETPRYTSAMPTRFRGSTIPVFFYVSVTLLGACSGGSVATEPTRGRSSYDTSPIDVETLAEDRGEQMRVLHMSAGEAAARLGSMHFEGRSYFSFSRGGKELSQVDRYLAHIDAAGNFAVSVDSGDTSVEASLVGETVYIRQNQGHMRQKPRRDATALDSWAQLAWTSQAQALEPFFARLVLEKGPAEMVEGRAARRYDLGLASEATPPERVERLPANPLPIAPPSRWRETGRAMGLQGSLWVDSDTGVIVKSKLEGKLEIQDRDVRPTQLSIRYDGEITQAGAAEAVEAPKGARPEYSRTPREVDALSFFRHELPKDPEESARDTP